MSLWIQPDCLVLQIHWLGEMDRAKSGWHHDGGFNLIDLLRAVDVERGSDAYSDSFDMDME